MYYDIEEIRRAAPLRKVVEQHTRKKRGRYICPFHDDHNPSLSIKGDRWKCWTCNKGGDVIDFIKYYYGLNMKDALRLLGDQHGIPAKDPADIWKQAEREARDNIAREVKAIREEAKRQAELLATAHRVLYKLGYEEAARRYEEELDNIEMFLGGRT